MSIESVMPSRHLILCRPLFSCPQSFPASGCFPMSQLFASGGQSIGVSASTSVLPKNNQVWFPVGWGWTGWISLQSKGLARVFSNTTVQKHQFFDAQLSSQSNSSWPHGLHQTRLPCPSLFSGVCSNSGCTEFVVPSNSLTLCHPLLLLPSIFPSIRVFSNELALYIRRPKYWSFSFSISPSNEYSELISFRIDWFDLLAVQGTLKSLLQHHN